MSEWESGLNNEQIQAVRHNFGPMLILAGAGSGKTTVLVARTGRLIAEKVAAPSKICVLTFTNKAARELKERVKLKLGAKGDKIWAGTFHSFGLRLLKKFYKEAGLPPRFGVIDAQDSQAIIRELLSNIRSQSKDAYDPSKILTIINSRRSVGGSEVFADEDYAEMADLLMPRYLEKLETLGVVDFEGLLVEPIRLLKKNKEILGKVQREFDQVMVDEFQDTNSTQMLLVDLLSQGHKNLSVVGDDDQSIYGWRGAEVKNILNFPMRFKKTKVVRLERNYRSTAEILNFANTVIAQNSERHDKVLKPSSKESGKPPELFVYQNEDQEVEKVVREIERFRREGTPYKKIAVIYRSNSQGGFVESELRSQNLPYQITGGQAFFDQKEAKDVLAYLRSAFTPSEVSLRRIIDTPPRGIGSTTVLKLSEKSVESGETYYKVLKSSSSWLPERSAVSVEKFMNELSVLRSRLVEGADSPGRELIMFFRENGFRDYLERTSKKTEVFAKKWKTVETLANILDKFAAKGGRKRSTFLDFLEAMELRDSPDDEENVDRISLMTMHASKGLEFTVVFLLGIEEDLIPHKTLGSDISEERRLFYVGITRAKKHLIMTRCKERRAYGKMRPVTPSRFLNGLEGKHFIVHEGDRPMPANERKSRLDDLFKNIDSKSESKRIN